MRAGYLLDHYWGIVPAARFAAKRALHFSKARRNVPDNDVAAICRKLNEDGVAILHDAFSEVEMRRLREIAPPTSTFDPELEGSQSRTVTITDDDTTFDSYFKNERLLRIARCYVSSTLHAPTRRVVGLKTSTDATDSFELNYHFDGWTPRLKAMLYLEDVGDEQAPLQYLKGSHRGLWRLSAESQLDRYFRTASPGPAIDPDEYFVGCFWPHEIRQLRDRFQFEMLTCTARAGSVLLFDGRGLHRGTQLQSGRRLVLLSVFTERDNSYEV